MGGPARKQRPRNSPRRRDTHDPGASVALPAHSLRNGRWRLSGQEREQCTHGLVQSLLPPPTSMGMAGATEPWQGRRPNYRTASCSRRPARGRTHLNTSPGHGSTPEPSLLTATERWKYRPNVDRDSDQVSALAAVLLCVK